ncbi:MAG: rod shape-determining protein MreC, partial [Janthinobacterium lividum]
YSPPPLFKQGPPALVRLAVFVVLALGLLITDAHFHTLKTVRQVVGTVLYPLQRAALAPRDMALGVLDFFASGTQLRAQNAALRKRNLELGLSAARAAELTVENVHLRALLELAQRSPVKPIPAEIQYDTRDPFTQKVIIDHGLQSGVNAGSPVINENGLIGQVSRVYPLQSEVTLLTDRDQAVPVQIVRTGVRSVVYGTANGDLLDLRFVPTGADIKPDDELVTSGLDGVYPPGLPVARVLRIERQSDSAFAKVVAAPIAQIRGVRQLLVLHYVEAMPPNPTETPASEAAPARNGKTGRNGQNAREVTRAGIAGSAGASAASATDVTALSASGALAVSEVLAVQRARSAETRRAHAQRRSAAEAKSSSDAARSASSPAAHPAARPAAHATSGAFANGSANTSARPAAKPPAKPSAPSAEPPVRANPH